MPTWVESFRPNRRPRALTNPLDPSQSQPAQGWFAAALASWSPAITQLSLEQEQSPFFRLLVPDIRHLIYYELLAGNTFHLSSSTTSAKPKKFLCMRPWQIVDSVHGGECHSNQLPKHLLSLPLTCRRIYTETIALLYQSTTFTFSQYCCFSSFLRVLPPQRYTSLNRLQYFHSLTESLITGDPASLRNWHILCAFLGSTFTPNLVLYLKLGPLRGSATRIRRAKAPEEMQWLDALWELSEKVQLKASVPSGDSGAFYSNKSSPTELMSVVLDFDVIKEANGRSREETLRAVFERMQIALWNWRPYGILIGEA